MAGPVERGNLVFGAIFVVLPLLLAIGALAAPSAGVAFGLTLAVIALLAFGFLGAIAFVDVA